MKSVIIFIFVLITLKANQAFSQKKDKLVKSYTMDTNYGIVLHGGAGNIQNRNLTPEKELAYKTKMQEALEVGYNMLQKGDSSVNVVEAVIRILEDSPLFNAGKGSVFTHEGTNEMDAAIMDGKTLDAGAVASVRTIKNPICAAKVIMQKSKSVFLSAQGAEQFAQKHNVEIVDTSYFFDQNRWDEYLRFKDTTEVKLDHDSSSTGGLTSKNAIDKFGTVGCVVLDKHGNLAAGTSTGGVANKRYNRIGDSPIIGAGTYANNNTCAVSCTGHGEDFIKLVIAHDVSALIEYKKISLKAATDQVIKKLTAIKGRGGLIAIDKYGNFAMPFNTSGMFRGVVNKKGEIKVFIYKEN